MPIVHELFVPCVGELSVEDIGPLRVPGVRVSLRETADQLTRLVEELDMVQRVRPLLPCRTQALGRAAPAGTGGGPQS